MFQVQYLIEKEIWERNKKKMGKPQICVISVYPPISLHYLSRFMWSELMFFKSL